MLLIGLVIFTLTRLGLAVYTGLASLSPGLWPGFLGKGLVFDLATLAVLLAPVLLYEALLPNRWRTSRWHRVLRFAWLWFSVALLLFGAVAEFTFWNEFSTRFNFIAVDYLLYTQEVIDNIRQSYPVGAILGGIALLALVTTMLLSRRVRLSDDAPMSVRRRLIFAVCAVALPALSIMLFDSDQMHGSGNAYADELSGNGLFTFAAALRRNELDYDKFYRTIAQADADRILSSAGVTRAPLGQATPTPDRKPGSGIPAPFNRRPRHVVLITVESLSAEFLGSYGSKLGLTPRLDRLAAEGLKFERLFATGTRTVRGLEALSLGTPPVPGQAIVRRPNNDHLATIGLLLGRQGFTSLFLYGGYGYFDNMNAYFAANDYRVVDRTDIPKESVIFENAWGVADEVLFNHTLAVMDRETAGGKPVFAQIMTTSNHRPYTYPPGRIDIASPGGREGAVKYTDYAIGKFIDDARAKPWFNDTLFVIVADHCASASGIATLPVGNYHIPMIFYAPALLAPGTYAPMVSQVDLPPTLISLLDKRGAELFYGQSMFDSKPAPQRAFISNYQDLGLLRDGVLTILLPKGRVESFKVDPVTYASTPIPVDEQRLNETIAYYQTASRAFKRGELKAPDSFR